MTIGIIGHRDIRQDQRQRIFEEIEKTLIYFQSVEPVEVVSFVASGADTIFYDVAEKLKIPIKVWLPFQEDIYREDFEKNKADLDKFETILKENEVEVKGRLPRKPSQKQKNIAYGEAGRLLVDQSDYIIAVWDGQSPQAIGGTADIVTYVWEDSRKTLIHIKADREETKEIASDDIEAQDLVRLDEQALLAKNHFRNVWIFGIIVGFLSVVFFAPTLFFKSFFEENRVLKLVLSAVELIFLPISYWLLCHKAHHAKNDFLEKRIAAERKRVHEEFKNIGIGFPTEIRTGDMASVAKMSPEMEQSKKELLEFVRVQINYHYHERVKKYARELHRMSSIMFAVVVAFFIVVGLGFIAELLEYNESELAIAPLFCGIVHWLHYLWVVFPALYAALEVIAYFKEWQHNIRVSEKILVKLEAVKKGIIFSGAADFANHTQQFKEILEIENEDWNTLIDNKHIGPYI